MMMEIETKIVRASWIGRLIIDEAHSLQEIVLPRLIRSDVSAKNRERRKSQLKWYCRLSRVSVDTSSNT
ncbi:hypothetical protein JG688_00005471 [Phytophthora aleatoria]|uniref:Uncharacterized protein n=1 Tax=Phytophthora aleatoria TaxID=2496075 RepID=A0A8J5MHL7_9STRA|nr:hypothetical protein JG688_00005471 [Phytophthora aleatoria]